MKPDMFWQKVLPHVLHKKRVLFQNHYRGKRVGIDLLGWLQESSQNFKEVIKCMYKRNNFYEPREALDMIVKRHRALVKAKVDPLYVFQGARPPNELLTIGAQNAVQRLNDYKHRSKKDDVQDNAEKLKAMDDARKVGATDPRLIDFLGKWMKAHGMRCMQAPFEASWQLVELERQGVTQATISMDSNICFALGSKQLCVKTSYGKKAPKCFQYVGEADFAGREHYKFDLVPYRNHLPELVAMIGCKYLPAPLGKDSGYILEHRLPKYFESLRNGDGFRFWQKQDLDRDYVHNFHTCINLFRYCPVLRPQPESKNLELVPLNALPDDEAVTWENWIGFDPVSSLPIAPEHYTSAANFLDGFSFSSNSTLDDWCRNCTPINFRVRKNPRS